MTSDIVWMETETVMLPDGTVDKVLVPKVYLAHAGSDAVKAGGALVTGAGVTIDTSEGIVNRGGVIDGGNGRTVLIAGQDIVNQGGAIKGGDVGLKAGRDVINQSLSVKQEYASVNTSGSYTSLSNQASITATGALGISAGRDVTDTGGTIVAASAAIQAGRDIAFNTLQTGSGYVADVNGNRQNDSSVTNKVGQISTTGDLSLKAGQDIKLSGTQVNLGATGNGSMLAGRDIAIAAVVDEVKTHQENDPASKSYNKIIHENQTVVGATVAAGGNLAIKAGDAGAGFQQTGLSPGQSEFLYAGLQFGAGYAGSAMVWRLTPGTTAVAVNTADSTGAVNTVLVDAGGVKTVNVSGSTQNCTNCVVVVDNLLTTGNPASALPRDVPVPFNQLGELYGTKFSGWTSQKNIESSLLSSGNGTRAVIYGTDGVDAHVWNAVVQNGKVNYIDGQIGGGGAVNFNTFTNFQFGVLP